MAWPVRHISQFINCTPSAVAEFAGNPVNLPRWARGVSDEMRQIDGEWVTNTPRGEAKIRFTGPIDAGVLDHDVVLPDGTVFHNPLRVLRNAQGSEVVFTLSHLPDMTDEDVERDAALITDDLTRLKALLETE